MDHYMEKINFGSNFKGVYEESLLRALYFNQLKPFNSRYHICNEVFMTIPIVIYTRKNFYLIDELNEKIENLKAAGLINLWNYQPIDERIRFEHDMTKATALRLEQLVGIFEIFGAGLLISFFVFAVELLKFKH